MIRSFVDSNCRALFKHPLLYLFVLVALTGFFGYFYATLPTETSVESLIIEDDPDLRFYEEFKDQFGEDEILVVGFPAEDVFARDILAYVEAQTQRLEQLDEIEDVVSLTNVEDFIGSDSDFIVQPLVEDLPVNPQESQEIRSQALDSSLIADHLVNRNADAALFLIRPAEQSEDPGFDERLVRLVEDIFTANPPVTEAGNWHIAGWLVTDVNLSRSMTRDTLTFMPLTFTLLIVLVGLALRNRWAILVAMVNVSVCLIWTLAFLNLVGGAMSPITSILPPLIMALAVSDSIHVFNAFLKQDRQHGSLPEIMRGTLKDLAVPCFLTSFTTAIGFASLAVSQVPPIRHFGLAAAGGMLAEFLLSMTLIPLGIYFLRRKKGLRGPSVATSALLHGPLERFARALPGYRTLLLWGSAGLIVFSCVAALNIRVETNLLEYFKQSSSVYQASEFIDNNLGGVETLEISLQAEQLDQLLEPDNLALIARIEQLLQDRGIVTEVTSIADFFREMNKAFHNDDPAFFSLPDSRALAAQYLLLYDGDELDNLLSAERDWTRISARITEHRSSVVADSIEQIREQIIPLAAEQGLTARITGKTLIAHKLIHLIVNSQVQSLSLALALIFLVMLAIFRSLKLGLIALVPNALPILLNFAIMGLFGFPLNSATAIIAAVAIGIAVDDTVHFICSYQNQRRQGQTTEKAIEHAVIVKGHPIITTSLIMMGAFAILLFGSFVPTIQFGILSALIMLFAVVSDLLVLPGLLLKFD